MVERLCHRVGHTKPEERNLTTACNIIRAYVSTFQLQSGALWDMRLVYCGICVTGLLEQSEKNVSEV